MSYGLSVGLRLPLLGEIISIAIQGRRAQMANAITESGIHRLKPVTAPISMPTRQTALEDREVRKVNKEKSCYFCLFGIPIIKCSFTKTMSSGRLSRFEGRIPSKIMNNILSNGYHCSRYRSIFRFPGLRHLLPVNIKMQTVIRSYEPPKAFANNSHDLLSLFTIKV